MAVMDLVNFLKVRFNLDMEQTVVEAKINTGVNGQHRSKHDIHHEKTTSYGCREVPKGVPNKNSPKKEKMSRRRGRAIQFEVV
ncbi:hypothetical protein CASFOL_011443 [Castilleja foliolosa]|uniref:Uncharacterized protein n=1 Tax=Castilleja foliolosa TaxID=1961234 RepID=A0ABD3DVX1_9LAMI